MWIETEFQDWQHRVLVNSFASNGECGLKQRFGGRILAPQDKFIRQQWRMWIETETRGAAGGPPLNSFASNGECGLKRVVLLCWYQPKAIHSPAMANVD